MLSTFPPSTASDILTKFYMLCFNFHLIGRYFVMFFESVSLTRGLFRIMLPHFQVCGGFAELISHSAP